MAYMVYHNFHANLIYHKFNSQVKSLDMTALEPPATKVCHNGWCSGDGMKN